MELHRRWKLHLCPLDSNCRREQLGVTWRLHLNTPWRHFGVALRPADKFARGVGQKAVWFMSVRTPR